MIVLPSIRAYDGRTNSGRTNDGRTNDSTPAGSLIGINYYSKLNCESDI